MTLREKPSELKEIWELAASVKTAAETPRLPMVNWLKCEATWFTHDESCSGLVIFLHRVLTLLTRKVGKSFVGSFFYPSPSNGIDVFFLWCFSFSVFCVCLHLSIGWDIKCLVWNRNRRTVAQNAQASERSVPSGLQTLRVKLVGLQVPILMPSMCGIFTDPWMVDVLW